MELVERAGSAFILSMPREPVLMLRKLISVLFSSFFRDNVVRHSVIVLLFFAF